jgi:hypothetical protein
MHQVKLIFVLSSTNSSKYLKVAEQGIILDKGKMLCSVNDAIFTGINKK